MDPARGAGGLSPTRGGLAGDSPPTAGFRAAGPAIRRSPKMRAKAGGKPLVFLALALAGCFLVPAGAHGASPLELELQLGGVAWMGDFRRFLDREGAYLMAPAAGITVSLFPVDFLGLRGRIDATTVIHPHSEPVEGTLSYEGIGPVFRLLQPGWSLEAYGLAGFQHATMQLAYFGSGYWQAGLAGQVGLGNGFWLVFDLAYRRGFLPSLLIPQVYDLAYPVVSESFLLGIGLGYRMETAQ